MKSYTLGLYEKAMPANLSWEEKLRTAKGAGYDFVEISIDETEEKLSRLDMPAQERIKLNRLAQETGIGLRTMCLSGHRKFPLGSSDPAVCARGMEILEKAIRLAEDLGIRIIQLAGYDVYYEKSTSETVRRFEENLQKASLLAARAGVLMGFETMETEFMNTVGKAMKYVNMVDSVYLNVYPDAGNITNAAAVYGTNVLEDLKTGAGHIAALHLKETAPGKFREIPFGTGHVDFKSMVHTAWRLGVRKYVAEFWYTGGSQWEADLAAARNMLGTLLDQEEQGDRDENRKESNVQSDEMLFYSASSLSGERSYSSGCGETGSLLSL
ncbi:MAG TPA: L-ribulose-5-phosphate 3-epimerase [Candidatus Choladousia intestinigallinarum]|nr:L-ribulose-5-phosphate 3-epimerase [Candidatus Choladousia intestinigallinarum]